MAWYAVHDATGALQSIGQVVADPLPVGWTAKDIGADRPADDQMWDAVTRAFVPRPPRTLRDRIADLLADTEVATLSSAQKARIQRAAERIFANVDWARYY